MSENSNKKLSCLLAISGGIDSTASAIILKDQGFEVTGITYRLFDSSESSLDTVLKVADRLNIKLIVADEREAFSKTVIQPFISEYLEGNTPNPCINCNKNIKFSILDKYRKDGGYDFMATGHYVQKSNYSYNSDEYYVLKKSRLRTRDQSYFLYNLTNSLLSKCIFPLGDITSKRFAEELLKSELINPYKKTESRGICFANKGHTDYLNSALKGDYSGYFVDEYGNRLFKHNAYFKYTIGQKKGLGFVIPKDHCVVGIKPITREVIIGNERLTYKSSIEIFNTNWLVEPQLNREYDVNLFKWGLSLKCMVSEKSVESGRTVISFKTPVRAPVSGQSAVIYDGEYLIGGGIINI